RSQITHGGACGRQPSGSVLGIAPHLVHALDAGIESASDEELLLACAAFAEVLGESIPSRFAAGLLDETAHFFGSLGCRKRHAHVELCAAAALREQCRYAKKRRAI